MITVIAQARQNTQMQQHFLHDFDQHAILVIKQCFKARSCCVGVEDDGYPRGLTVQELDISYNTLKAMAVAVNATIQPLKEMPACRGRVYVIFRISRICLDSLSYTDLRIAGKPLEHFPTSIAAPKICKLLCEHAITFQLNFTHNCTL